MALFCNHLHYRGAPSGQDDVEITLVHTSKCAWLSGKTLANMTLRCTPSGPYKACARFHGILGSLCFLELVDVPCPASWVNGRKQTNQSWDAHLSTVLYVFKFHNCDKWTNKRQTTWDPCFTAFLFCQDESFCCMYNRGQKQMIQKL